MCDPSHPDYDDLTDSDSPNYIDPNQTAAWLPECNLVDTGDSEYAIDLADLMEFRDNGWWLWTACWKESQTYRFGMMAMAMGGGESAVMSESYAMESSTADSHVATNVTEGYESPTLEQSAAAILDYVNWYIEENHPNPEALYDMKAFLEDTLKELRKEK